VRVSKSRAAGARLTVSLGCGYFGLMGGEPSPILVAAGGMIAALVALGVTLVEPSAAGAAEEGPALGFLKGAGAGSALFFALSLTAELPEANRTTIAVIFLLPIVWVLLISVWVDLIKLVISTVNEFRKR
jgi:hypothetical protein